MSGKYYIYILINPFTNNVFYVGCTRSPFQRFSGHKFQACKKLLCKAPKDIYIVRLGEDPIMQIIEEVDASMALETEDRWMQFFKEEGFKLMNVRWNQAA